MQTCGRQAARKAFREMCVECLAALGSLTNICLGFVNRMWQYGVVARGFFVSA